MSQIGSSTHGEQEQYGKPSNWLCVGIMVIKPYKNLYTKIFSILFYVITESCTSIQGVCCYYLSQNMNSFNEYLHPLAAP